MGTDGSATYTYDLFNRQKTHTSGGVVTTTTYRPDGLRHSIGGTKHIWDGGNIVGEYVGSTYKKYFRALTLIYRLTSNTKQWYNTNGHGDVISLTDTNGVVVKTYTYNAFGEEEDISTTDGNPFRYCGEYYDTACGTLYLRARNYDATTGRFTQQDGWEYGDISEPLSLNLYIYGWNSPINGIDPSGHLFGWAKKLIAAVVVVAVVAVVAAVVVATAGAGSFAAAVAVGAAKGAAVGAIQGAIGGGVVGAATGAVKHRVETGSWEGAGKAALEGGLEGMADGALSGAISGAISGGVTAAQNYKPVDVEVKYKEGWTPEQRAQADMKAKQLTDAKTKVTKVNSSDRSVSARKIYNSNNIGNEIPKGYDADHIIDLQLGGKNVPTNIQPLDASVNRSLGTQIHNAIKHLPRGTQIGRVTIK